MFPNILIFLIDNLDFANLKNMFLKIKKLFNPLTSPGEVVTVFASPYLSAGPPAQGEAKGLNVMKNIKKTKPNKKTFFKNRRE